MIVLSLYYTDKPGGFCKRLYRLLNALSDRNHTVFYYTLDPASARVKSEVTVKQIPFPLKARGGLLFWLLFTVWCPVFIFAEAIRVKPTHCIAFSPFYGAMLALVRIFTGSPLILFLRSLSFKTHRITGLAAPLRAISSLLDRIGLALSSKVICMTQAMAEEVRQEYGTEALKLKVLPNDLPAISLPPKIKTEQGPFQALSAGVLDRRKNISLLLEAWRVLSPPPSDYSLTIAGEGPLRAKLEAMAPPGVSFVGWQQEIMPLLSTTDLLIHPALHEGVPNIVLEALAADIPVLASRVPEMAEILESDELLFDPEDSEELSQKLKKLLHKKSEFDKISELSKHSSQKLRFDWDEAATSLLLD